MTRCLLEHLSSKGGRRNTREGDSTGQLTIRSVVKEGTKIKITLADNSKLEMSDAAEDAAVETIQRLMKTARSKMDTGWNIKARKAAFESVNERGELDRGKFGRYMEKDTHTAADFLEQWEIYQLKVSENQLTELGYSWDRANKSGEQ